jgi:predicted RNA binding protein YcfA (HicA-like mRNA interferase family)
MVHYALVAVYPSMKAGDFLASLQRQPLGYTIKRQKGSHRILEAPGRPRLIFSYGDGATVPPGVVRKYLETVIGLSTEDALDLLRG